jgi:hypothetical protein
MLDGRGSLLISGHWSDTVLYFQELVSRCLSMSTKCHLSFEDLLKFLGICICTYARERLPSNQEMEKKSK